MENVFFKIVRLLVNVFATLVALTARARLVAAFKPFGLRTLKLFFAWHNNQN